MTLFDTITETGAKLVAAGFKPDQVKFTVAGLNPRIQLADELREKFGLWIMGEPGTNGRVGGFQIEFQDRPYPDSDVLVSIDLA